MICQGMVDVDDHSVIEIEETGDEYRPFRLVTPHFELECEYREQAEDMGAVYLSVGGFREEKVGGRGVPPGVSFAGMPEVVTYLLAHPESGVSLTEWFVRSLDVERATVHSYLSRVRGDARAAVEEETAE